MVNIQIRYLGNRSDTQYNGFFNALGRNLARGEYVQFLREAILELNDIDIDSVVKTIKNLKKDSVLPPNTIFIVTMDVKEYYLSNKFELISEGEFGRADFAPYIEFDKSNCDINKEKIVINEILKYQDSKKAIETIKSYIKKPSKQYRYISNKPNIIFLYNLYQNEPIKFGINTNNKECQDEN